jgi:hypothetical protein
MKHLRFYPIIFNNLEIKLEMTSSYLYRKIKYRYLKINLG